MRQCIRFCKTGDGIRIAYATAGRGRPLMRAGGWLTHVERDWDSPVWRHWLRELTSLFTLARFDIRGSGLSDRDVPEQSLDAWVRDLEAVADDLGWQQFTMMGLCQGGAIALAYAVRHPERVSRLVLYNSYSAGALAIGADTRAAEQARTLTRMIEMGWGRHTSAFRDVFARLLMPHATEEQIRWWEELQRVTVSPNGAARLWVCFHQLDIRNLLEQVRVPTLVAHVRGDTMVPFESGRALASSIPGARFLPLEGDNHVLQPNEPGWRAFVAELRAFLADATETAGPGFSDLTRRERAILDRIAVGLSNAEIATDLSIAPKTVRNHVSNICGKLGVSSRGQAIVMARGAGFGAE